MSWAAWVISSALERFARLPCVRVPWASRLRSVVNRSIRLASKVVLPLAS